MADSVVPWPSIQLLANMRTTLTRLQEVDPVANALPSLYYRAKVKLHGANHGVQRTADGRIVAQSHHRLLSAAFDPYGFERWVRAAELAGAFVHIPAGTTVFGEWAGPGVERGMAISALPTKVWVVFGAINVSGELIDDPEVLSTLFPLQAASAAGIYVLPWLNGLVWIDHADAAQVERAAAELSAVVAEVESEDPWVKAVFGISGLGEGIVLYPRPYTSGARWSAERAAALMFKAKGLKHRTVATAAAVQATVPVAAGVEDFVALVVTPGRLEQGLGVAAGGVRDQKLTGKFVAWIVADVRKECAAELQAAGLTWSPAVERAISGRARSWFLGR